jgi:hypothetical protein
MDFEDKLLNKTEELDVLLNEVFSVKNKPQMKNDLKLFLQQQFKNGNLRSAHQGLSTTEFKPNDWLEDISDNILNQLEHYFEVLRSQTERDL